ncbi:MAG: KPN_02809 family neutral zinc metallopeptidase [Polyangiales bacterium]
MRWDEGHSSPDLIDRRGQRSGGGGLGGGLLYLLPFLLRSPIGWVILIVGGLFYLFSGSFTSHEPSQSARGGGPAANDPQGREVKFVGFVLDDTQKTWDAIFRKKGLAYRHAKLVLFTDATETGCGFGRAATGPFYCPTDERVYIDLGFYKELTDRLGAKGEFAQAYVVAHEIGHHVQKLLGTSNKLRGLKHTEGAEGASVRLELQADCYAGIWSHSTKERDLLEEGDIDSALNAASAIGDDRLQKEAKGRVAPDSFTHGTSAQRTRWFRKGYDAGDLASCDTFSASSL